VIAVIRYIDIDTKEQDIIIVPSIDESATPKEMLLFIHHLESSVLSMEGNSIEIISCGLYSLVREIYSSGGAV
jgi:hypothetical protein